MRGRVLALVLALMLSASTSITANSNSHGADPQGTPCGTYNLKKNEVIAGVKFPKGNYQIYSYNIACNKVLGSKGFFTKFLKQKDKDPLPKPWKYLPNSVGAGGFTSGPGVGFRVQIVLTTIAAPAPSSSALPTPTPTPTPTPLPTPTIISSSLSTSLGVDSSGDYLVNADIASTSRVDVGINVSSPSLVKEVVIGLKPVASTNFYDWGLASFSSGNAIWARSVQMPTVNPAPVCTNGVSSKVMWEVKYEIRLTSGAVLAGVLPTKVARVFTGVYCPSGLYPMFGTPQSTVDGYSVQITNYDPSFQWTVGSAVRADLTLNGTATTTISSSGLIVMSGLKPGVTASLIVRTSKSGHPTQESAFAAKSLS